MMKSLIFAVCLCLTAPLALAEKPATAEPLFNATLNGQTGSLHTLRGQPLIVNFWASWCVPCRAEIPDFVRFHERHPDTIKVVGVNLDEQTGQAQDMIRNLQVNYPTVWAGKEGLALMRALGNPTGGLPYTVFIDSQGRIVHRIVGLTGTTELNTQFRKLIAR